MRKCLFLTKSDMLLKKGKANDIFCISASKYFYTEECLQCEEEQECVLKELFYFNEYWYLFSDV